MATATDKQLSFIQTLSAERELDNDATVMLDALTSLLDKGAPSKRIASDLISHMMRLPRLEVTDGTTRVDPAEGFYRSGQDVFRVKVSKSGNWYAQRCQLPLPGSGRSKLFWEYIGRRVDLSGAELLDDAEAGRFLGFCVRCSAELTDPDSIARGMGPVCAKK